MLNQIVLVGRIVNVEKRNDESAILTIKIPRYFKNENGEYDNDIIDVTLNGQIATNTITYCKDGDIIGVKGRIQSDNGITIVAEKVTFLSTNKND